jgi:hypothetical protein
MAGRVSSGIVKEGLVMAVDASDRLSYPGSGTTLTDLSGNNNNALFNGGYTASNSGAFTFNGTNQYSDLPFQISTNFTIEAVINTSNVTKKQGIVSNYSNANDGVGLEVFGAGSGLNFFVFLSGVVSGVTVSNVLTNNTINHVAATKSGTSYSLYLNGRSLGTTTGGATITQSQNLRIGTDRSTSQTINFVGNMYNIKVYNRGITAQEVLQNFNATRWKFGI